MKRIPLLVVSVALLLSLGCTKREDLVVVEIANRKITVADFEEASANMEEKYLPTADDLEGKKQLLEHIINKEVMALKARASGYDKDEEFVKFWERFRNPFLVAALENEYVRKQVSVTEEEIEAYWKQMHYEYTLSQILIGDEDYAWDVKRQIVDGLDFAEAAKRYSWGPTAEDGGFIGSNVIGKIHWWVEEALFNMKEGDVTDPIRTTSGFALLKLHRKREIIPDLDREYARKRVQAIKEKKKLEELKAKIEKEIELRFFPDAIQIAYDALPDDIPFEDIISYKVTRSNAPKMEIPEQYAEMLICQYSSGTYTLRDFEEYYNAMGLPERPRRQYGKESILVAIHKRVFDTILPSYAENVFRVLDIPSVRLTYERRKDQFLVHMLYQDQVRDGAYATDMEVSEYYKEHKDEYMTREQRDFSVVLVGSEEEANDVAEQAREGTPFVELVRKYSEEDESKENRGRTGLVFKGKYPEYDEVVFSMLQEGEISDPFGVPRGWAVVKIERIEKGNVPTFEEARETISRELMERKAEEILMGKLEQWRKDYIVKEHYGNLAKARLKRIRL